MLDRRRSHLEGRVAKIVVGLGVCETTLSVSTFQSVLTLYSSRLSELHSHTRGSAQLAPMLKYHSPVKLYVTNVTDICHRRGLPANPEPFLQSATEPS